MCLYGMWCLIVELTVSVFPPGDVSSSDWEDRQSSDSVTEGDEFRTHLSKPVGEFLVIIHVCVILVWGHVL